MQQFIQFMRVRRYSPRTIMAYTSLVRTYLKILGKCAPASVRDEDLTRYINKFYVDKGYSRSYQNQVVNALKLYYSAEFGRKIGEFIKLRPRPEIKLPNILSTEEVKKLLSSFKNEKHRTIFYFIYADGMRISEVTHLRVTDIDASRNIIHIRQSKGAKDRNIPLSKKALEQLRTYYKLYNQLSIYLKGNLAGCIPLQVFRRCLEKL